VIVEAAASALPSVVAAAGAAHEHVVDGVTGLVVDGGKPAQLAAAMLRLIDDPALRVELGAAAHARAASYDLAAAVRATFDVYGRVMASRAASHLEAAS
jgi:D-inositol-3-phosphate glycosyltransferase